MGRMKEWMMERMEAQAEFVEFVQKILSKQQYEFKHGNDPWESYPDDPYPYDFSVRGPDGVLSLVDVNVYGSSQIDPALIANALLKLSAEAKKFTEIVRTILVVNVELPRQSSMLEGRLDGVDYQVVDLQKIRGFIGENEDEMDRLYELLDFLRDDHPDTLGPALTPQIFDRLIRAAQRNQKAFSPLVEDIRNCPEGDGHAFETACSKAIEAVFANEFNRWVRQNYVEGGFHKLDLLGHLHPKNDFWLGLRSDFRTRYIVFEFKNYKEAISQNEIYTTEKYLFPGALRTVAIVIARNGEDAGATRARNGALRESGKLILMLTQADLITIIEKFEAGEDHHEPLVDALHNMLRSLGR